MWLICSKLAPCFSVSVGNFEHVIGWVPIILTLSMTLNVVNLFDLCFVIQFEFSSF